MLNEIACNFNWYRDKAEVFLQFKGQTLKAWLEYMYRKGRRCDELGIYALSVLYDRHTVVFGRGRPWCTIRPTGDPFESDFANSCDVHLLYVGDSVFAPLTPQRNNDNGEYDTLNTALQAIQDKYTKKYASDTWQFTVDPVSDFVEITGSRSGVWGPTNRHVHADKTTVSTTSTTPTNNTIDDEHNSVINLLVDPLTNTQSGLSENLADNLAVNDNNGLISEKPVPRTGTEPLKSATPVNSSMSSDNTKQMILETPPPVPVKSMTSRNH